VVFPCSKTLLCYSFLFINYILFLFAIIFNMPIVVFLHKLNRNLRQMKKDGIAIFLL